jgi:DUF971 family protein
MSSPLPTPAKLDLKKDQGLTVHWSDGKASTFTLTQLRTMCPCALCKTVRTGSNPHDIVQQPKKATSLSILPGNFAEPLKVLSAELVGNYAIQLEWSDGHGSGIYSWNYLREISDSAR